MRDTPAGGEGRRLPGGRVADIAALSDRYWDLLATAEPVWATVVGDHRFDDQMPDLSAEAEAERARQLRDLADAAEAVNPDHLSETDRHSRSLLVWQARAGADVLDSRMPEFTVAPMFIGPQAQLLQLAPLVTLPLPEHAEALLQRYAQAGRFMDQGADRLREGMAAGRTPPLRAVRQVIDQLDSHLASDLRDDPMLSTQPPADWSGSDTWREQLNGVIRDHVRPALARYRDVLAQEVAPVSREPERSGLCWLPGGQQVYARSIRNYTSTQITAEQAHDIGLEAVDALAAEYREIGSRALGEPDVATLFRRLLEDPDLRFADAGEIIASATAALRRAEDAVSRWFGRLPEQRCVIEPQSPAEAAGGVIAFYHPPASDGSRPGSYRVLTADPAAVTRVESEATAFHETLPGHHLQIALGQETDLPRFRRESECTAYVEGWGLYSERLAQEMDLYSDDLARLGMLALDSLRSARLVVDTGLHAKGWSRQQAIDYLESTTPVSLKALTGETDRYVVLPGQALSYKVGQRAILQARARAEAALGVAFDIRGFHDAVLGQSAVTLGVLDDIVDTWVAQQAG